MLSQNNTGVQLAAIAEVRSNAVVRTQTLLLILVPQPVQAVQVGRYGGTDTGTDRCMSRRSVLLKKTLSAAHA